MSDDKNIFSNLRRLAKSLEHDIDDMNKSISVPKHQRDDSCAISVLQNTYKDVKHLKVNKVLYEFHWNMCRIYMFTFGSACDTTFLSFLMLGDI